jgi:hypothetical protein
MFCARPPKNFLAARSREQRRAAEAAAEAAAVPRAGTAVEAQPRPCLSVSSVARSLETSSSAAAARRCSLSACAFAAAIRCCSLSIHVAERADFLKALRCKISV